VDRKIFKVEMCKNRMDLKTIKVYEADRNKLEKLKRRHKKKTFADVIKSILNLIRIHKMEDELK
jgi:ornithine cyclodeaminase/alanine dehydrogenase-like protein (mu-crystallin family)